MKIEAENITNKDGTCSYIVRVFGGAPDARKLVKEIAVPTNDRPIKFCESQVGTEAYEEYRKAVSKARKLDMVEGLLKGHRGKINQAKANEIFHAFIARNQYWSTVHAFHEWLTENGHVFKYSVVRTDGYGIRFGKKGKQAARFAFIREGVKIRKLIDDPALDIPKIILEVL